MSGDDASSDFFDSDDEPSDEQAGRDEDTSRGDEAEEVDIENFTSEEEIRGFYDPVVSQRRLEREHDSNSRSGSDRDFAQYAWRNPAWNSSPTITSSPESELSVTSSTNANLKVVFGVEYRPPDSSDPN